MADEDKLLGIAKTNRTTEYTYSAYRIDYDSADSIAEIVTVEEADDEGNTITVTLAESDQSMEEYFTGATKNPPAGYPGHEAQGSYTDGSGATVDYKRKLLVEDATTRDEVEAELGSAGVAYETTDVSPTSDEKAHIEDYGAENSLEGGDAMAWKRALEDLAAGTISQVDLERGRNPNASENFGRPKANGRGPK